MTTKPPVAANRLNRRSLGRYIDSAKIPPSLTFHGGEGVHGRPFDAAWNRIEWWCGRRGLNPHGRSRGIFLPTTVFTAAFRRSWSGLYLHPGFRFRCCPSSLYTFLSRGLARDCHFTGFPDFEQFYSQRFRRCTQIRLKSLVSTSFTTSACSSANKGSGSSQLLNAASKNLLDQSREAGAVLVA